LGAVGGGLGCALALLSSGCKVGPSYHAPQTPAPAAWAGVTKAPTNQPSITTTNAVALARWWEEFGDPKLTALIEQAGQTNLDLQLAQARLRQARAERGVAAGGLWPAVTGSASYQRVHPSGSTVSFIKSDHNLFAAGLDAVWELDLFGGTRRNVEAAGANIRATQESLRDAQISLAAEVALNYIQLRGYQQQIAIAQDNLKIQRRTAEITRRRQGVGFVSGLDVANAEALVATTEAQVPVLETAAQQTIYALSVLLTRPPADLLAELSPTGPLPATPPEIPVGLPSELLRRRPDIRAAEASLQAATAKIGVAVADLFPKFSLVGSVNWQNNLLEDWFTAGSRGSSFGPTVTWPLFQGGAVRSNIRVQEALRDQSYLTYQKTVLTALQDVENALIAFAKEWQHRASLEAAVASNRKAVDLSTQLYAQGQSDFLNVLVAQRSLAVAEDALVQSRRDIATDVIALYKALGGGWEEDPSIAAVRTR